LFGILVIGKWGWRWGKGFYKCVRVLIRYGRFATALLIPIPVLILIGILVLLIIVHIFLKYTFFED
jgi:hypothetical protein